MADLLRVTAEHNLGAVPSATDGRLHLVRREVLHGRDARQSAARARQRPEYYVSLVWNERFEWNEIYFTNFVSGLESKGSL